MKQPKKKEIRQTVENALTEVVASLQLEVGAKKTSRFISKSSKQLSKQLSQRLQKQLKKQEKVAKAGKDKSPSKKTSEDIAV